MTHLSRLCHFVIDVFDLDQGVRSGRQHSMRLRNPCLNQFAPILRRLRLPDSEICILLQKTGDEKASRERMHLDLATGDWKPKSVGLWGSARHDGITGHQADLSSGSCATHGATNSVCSRRSLSDSSPGKSHKTPDQQPTHHRSNDKALLALTHISWH